MEIAHIHRILMYHRCFALDSYQGKTSQKAVKIRDDSFRTSSFSPAASSTYSEASWIDVFSMHPGISSRSSCSTAEHEQWIRPVHRMPDASQCAPHGSDGSWSFRWYDQHPVRHWFERRERADRCGRSLRGEERWPETSVPIENGVCHSMWKDTLISREITEHHLTDKTDGEETYRVKGKSIAVRYGAIGQFSGWIENVTLIRQFIQIRDQISFDDRIVTGRRWSNEDTLSRNSVHNHFHFFLFIERSWKDMSTKLPHRFNPLPRFRRASYRRRMGDWGQIKHRRVHPTIETKIETNVTINNRSSGVKGRCQGRSSANWSR